MGKMKELHPYLGGTSGLLSATYIYLIAILNEIVRHKRCLKNFDFSCLSA